MREARTSLPPLWRGAGPLVLASRSESRRALLSAAGLDAESVAPEVDERALEDGYLAGGGSLENVAIELARAKALAVSAKRPDAYCIGADQTLTLEGRILHKSRDLARSGANARRARGEDASFDLRVLRRPRRPSARRPQRSCGPANASPRSGRDFALSRTRRAGACCPPLARIRARVSAFICSSVLKGIIPLFSDCRC